MKFKTADILEEEGLSFEGEIAEIPESANLVPIELGQINLPLSAQFEISVGSKDFLLLGSIQGSFDLCCSRCLNRFRGCFEQHLEQLYPKDLEELDITETLREAIVLAVPTKPLCNEGCLGLCPHCGINLNLGSCACKPQSINPFAKLKEFFKEERK